MRIDDIKDLDLEVLLNDNPDEVKKTLDSFHPYDVAKLIEIQNQEIINKLYTILSPDDMVQYFEHFEFSFAARQLELLEFKKAIQIVSQLEIDDAANILRKFNETEQKKYLHSLSKEKAATLRKILDYDEDKVGSILNPSYIFVPSDITVKEASKRMVQQAKEVDNIDYIYVVDNNVLRGVLSLKELLTSGKSLLISEVCNDNIQTLSIDDDKEKCINIMQDYDIGAVPVINNEGQMLGIITVDDVIDVVENEAAEDFGKFAAITDGDIGDMDQKVFKSVKNRIPWLILLLLIGIFTSSIIASFENTIAQVAILAVFLTLVLDMSGNVGTQSLATTVRLLSSNQLDDKNDVKKHLLREFGIGVLNSITITILIIAVVVVFQIIQSKTFSFEYVKTALVIGASMIVSLIVSNLIGALIPIIISKFHIDPATASGPFITTISDIVSLLIYFGFATIFLL